MAWPVVRGMRSLAFATPGPLRNKLNRLVLSGTKVATTGLLSEYEHEGEKIEEMGERLALVDDANQYLATVEVTGVRVCRFDEVSLAHAVAEGEGWRSLDEWRRDHRDYYKGQDIEVDHSTPVVCLSFRLVSD